MKFNKKLFPMKVHFFTLTGGTAPIIPLLPLILRGLGYSSISVGWIFTAYPLILIFVKPLCGTIADKYRCHRVLFFILLSLQLITGFATQWLPPIPFNTTAELICDKNLSLKICSERLNDSLIENVNHINKIEKTVNNTITCKVDPENWKKYTGWKNQTDDEDTLIRLGPEYYFKENCLVAEISLFDPSAYIMEQCKNKTSILMDIFCEDEDIMEVLRKKSVDGAAEIGTTAFWITFALVISIKILVTVVQGFADAYCFILLGDKPQNYGAQRMWGAASWGMFSVINGIVLDKVSEGRLKKNFTPSYYMFLVVLLLDILVVSTIKAKFTKKSKNVVSDIKKLFTNLRVILFLFWCFLGGIYCAIIWFFLFWFIEDLAASSPGFDKSWLSTMEGLMLAIQCCIGEVLFFFVSGWILKKVGPAKAMVIVLFCIATRFLIYSSITNPWWVLPVEVFNGVTFGLCYAVMVTYASSIAPPGTEVTVQTVVSSLYEGGGTSVGSLLCGYMFKKIGSSKTILIFGISALVFTLIYIFLQPKLEIGIENNGVTAKEYPEEKDKGIDGEELAKLTAPS